MTPTKNGDRPIASEASLIEPTRISDITPTATPAIASEATARRTDHGSPPWSSASCEGLKRLRCVRSEKRRPAAYEARRMIATANDICSSSDGNCLDSSVGLGSEPPITSS